ncbi:MAG: alkaline phosphatase family protein [Nanoarchaeota archaeon]
MKGVLVILDGLGDLPCQSLQGKTPLEAAETPNMDFLATRGELGLFYTVKPGFIPESDEAIVSIFGNDLIKSTRGQLEARGTDLKLVRGDLALRANFAAIDSYKEGNIIDRRAGRTLTTKEAEELAKAVNSHVKLSCKFVLKPTIQHRSVLVFRGGFSDSIIGNDSTYIQGQFKHSDKIRLCYPSDDEDNSQYSANVVNEFLEKAYEVLDVHHINKKRKGKGLLPANFLLVRGAGIEPPNLKQYGNWVSSCYMPLEIGFSRVSGMQVKSFDYPKLKGVDSYGNLWDALRKACKFSVKVIKKYNKKIDYVYVHLKETDLPGHDNKPIEKKDMIEHIDKTLFKFLRNFAPSNNIKIVVTGDHATPCRLKSHSADPVPVLLYNSSIPKEKRYDEKEAARGSLGKIVGKEFFEKIGFDK